jgi:titin
MNSLFRARFAARTLAPILIMLALAAPGSVAFAADQNSRDIAAIDRILAGVKPGQTIVELGDMGVTPEQLRAIRGRLAGAPQTNAVTPSGTSYKWPGGIVYFRFDNDTAITAERKQAFRDAIAEWTAFANVQFVELPSPPAAPGQSDYVQVRNDPTISGGFSAVGRVGGQQLMRIGSNAWNRGTIVHEMGHALGLWHEHQREDRDTYVTILWDNIPQESWGNFVKISELGTGPGVNVGAYDFQSVMHYSQTAFSSAPNLNSIVPKPAYNQYLNNLGAPFDRTLSKLDRAGIAAIYGPPAAAPGAVVTNTKDSGPGTLRTAIYYAWDRSTDVAPVPTTITFQIPTSDPGYNTGTGTFTIRPTSLLVAPGDGTTIDGATQTAFTGNTNASGPEVVISGSQIVAPETYSAGLRLRTSNCVVKDLVINGFNQWGIQIDGTQATGNVVRGCYIGTNASGTAAAANAFPGIEISNGANGNTIGGTTAAHRNVISGNSHNGLQITGAGSDSNVIQGNFIGTNAAGTAALPNLFDGIEVLGGAKFNVIGGTAGGAGNVISGNPFDGLRFRGAGTENNLAQGNLFGLNATGTAAIANQNSGVRIFEGAKANIVGGTTAAARNVISGNSLQGVIVYDSGTDNNSVLGNYIGLRADGTAAVPNGGAGVGIYGGAKTNTIGSTVAGNVISGNAREGVTIANAGTTGNAVIGNRIGTDSTGAAALANAFCGVGIYDGAQSNTVGGTSVAARNIISGNASEGVVISGTGANGNFVLGNFIGLNASGAAALPNVFRGVGIYGGAQANTIGGATSGARNVISGNSGQGVLISNAGSSGNFVQGNFIGSNPGGTAALPNGNIGVAIWGGAQSNTIGGTAPGAGNLISGNNGQGILIADSGSNANSVLGNFIGTNSAGTSALSNTSAGVAVWGGAQSNNIGGTAPGAGNVISGNGDLGIYLADSGTSGNVVRGNLIGTNAAGTAALANRSGIGIYGSATGNIIGGAAPGSRNIISGNSGAGAGDGVIIGNNGSSNNQIIGNTIGWNAAGTAAIPNSGSGVVLYGNISGNVIGGTTTTPGAANLIAGNAGNGVVLYGYADVNWRNPILGNSIFGNGSSGIANLGGTNNSQAAPVLTGAVFGPTGNAGGTSISGSMANPGGATLRLEFFASPAGSGEAKFFLGAGILNSNGNFSAPLAAAVPAGYTAVATATDLSGNTSNFSNAVTVTSSDTDLDGIPNAWTEFYWGHPMGNPADKSLAGDDADGDGFTNLEELRAGTNPRDPSSRLKITIDRVGSDARLSLPTVPGKTYRIDFTGSLFPSDWRLLSDQLSGTGATLQLSDPGALGLPARNYRATVVP